MYNLYLALIVSIFCNSCQKGILQNGNSKSINTKPSLNLSLCNFDGKNYKYHDNVAFKEYLFCLSDSIFIGNLSAINDYVKILNQNDLSKQFHATMDIMNVKGRGSLIFETILIRGNYFGCYNDKTINEKFGVDRSFHELIFHGYTSMIHSIDGMSVEKYIGKNEVVTQEMIFQLGNELCYESYYKSAYNTILRAYKGGKIVLKKFGEE